MRERRTIGEILQELGRISQHDVERALEHQSRHGGFFGEALIALGLVRREELGWSLASQFDLPYVFPESGAVDPEAAGLVTAEWALRHTAIPITRSGDLVTLVVDSPLEEEAVRDLREKTGLAVELALAAPDRIRDVIREVYLEGGAADPDEESVVTVRELFRRVREGGGATMGISIRGDRAVGWYEGARGVHRRRLATGWANELEALLSPSPSERAPSVGEGAWTARLQDEERDLLVEVRTLSTTEGRELLVTHDPPERLREDPPPLPRGLLDELHLLVRRGRILLLVQSEPDGFAARVLPHLPALLLPSGHRSLHLAPRERGVRIPGVLSLPLEGPGGWAARTAELAEFRFDAVSAEAGERSQAFEEALTGMAPRVFLAVPADEPAGRPAVRPAWALHLWEGEGLAECEWTLQPLV